MNKKSSDFQLLHEFYNAAKENLTEGTWDYLVGGAESETTLKRNRAAFDAIAFRPRVLRDVENVDTSATLLGQRLRVPVVLAPIGSLQDFHPEGAAAVARAANRFGTISILSSVSHPGLEATAAACGGPKIFQLYVRGDAFWVEDHVRRAIDAGYIAFCFTVDLDYYVKRERDVAKRYITTGRRMAGKNEEHQRRFSWREIARIRERFDIPLIVKGIATAEDAKLAVEHGIEVVYLSNHGGRELDHGRGALDVLPEVVEAVNGKAGIVMDGGILRGSDVVKAMALGADAVGIARLYGFGLGAAGEAGVSRVLDILEGEIRSTLGLLGVTNWSELDQSYLHPGAPRVYDPGYRSAFPLLQADD